MYGGHSPWVSVLLQWKDAYPSATLYACPGLPEKEPDKGCAVTHIPRCQITSRPHVLHVACVSHRCGPVIRRYDATVGINNQAPDSWLGEIEVTHLSYEAVPLLRKPFFNEVSMSPAELLRAMAACGSGREVDLAECQCLQSCSQYHLCWFLMSMTILQVIFLHKPSGTLIVTDCACCCPCLIGAALC